MRQHTHSMAASCALAAILAAMVLVMTSGSVWPHDAKPTAAQPNGLTYPYACCSGIDCREVGDGKASKAKVKILETATGYQISTTGEIIAFGDSRLKDSPDGVFHWCSVAGADDSRTICLFKPPRGFC